jgi:hypothetical protein
VADAVAEFDACAELAVAVSVTCLAGRAGAASSACTSTFCPALRPLTVHLDLPDGTHTENVGLTLLGFAESVILAEPPLPLVSQTQIAYPIVVFGSTALTLFSVCTVMHSVPVGGGVVGVFVGVGVVLGVAVGVAIGDFSVPPGVSPPLDVAVLFGAGCGRLPPGAGVADMPGLGLGSGSVLELGLGCVLGRVLGLLRRTASARSTGMPAGCCACAPVRAAGRVSALVEAVAVGLAVAEDEHGLVLAGRVPCTPVISMLTAP